MGGEQRSAPNFKEKCEAEAQQEEILHDEGEHRGNVEETDRSESRQIDGGESQTIPAVVSSGTGTMLPLSPACEADEAKTPWKENPCAPEARAGECSIARISSNDSKNHAYASTVDGGTDKQTGEQRCPGGDVHPACDEAEKSGTCGQKKEEKEARPAAKERLDVATVDTGGEAPQVEETTAGGNLRDGELCTVCGTRTEYVACNKCRRYFHPACGADSQADTVDGTQRLCRACRVVDGSNETENTLRETGIKKGAQKQRFVDTMDEDMQADLAEDTGSNGNNRGGSDGRGKRKVEHAEEPAADSSIGGPGGSKVHAGAEALAKQERPKESHCIVDSKEWQEELCVGSEAGGDTSCAPCSSASAAGVKAETVSSKAEGPVKPVTGGTDGVDVDRTTTEGDSTKSAVENRTYAVEGAPSAEQGGNHLDGKGALAGESSKVEEHGKSNTLSSKSAAGVSTVESSRVDSGSSRSADDSGSGLEASKSATESKEGIVAAQERRGSGAEDEEEEEEEAELLQGGLSGGSEKKEYMASRKRGGGEAISRGKPTSPRSLSPSPCQYRRKRRRGDNGAVATRCKVNVGPRHQVPALPPFFLDSSCTRDGRAERLPETRELYSHDAGDTARLVYSPFAMQRVYRRRLAEGTTGESGIRNADEMNDFIRKVAENWTNKTGWQPFSPEYAYKLLHFAGYDPQRALRIMKDSRFCFTTICDPPQRRYDNKWRPKDRRGQIATHPYPSPLTLRAYLSRRNQHAAATAAADNASSHG